MFILFYSPFGVLSSLGIVWRFCSMSLWTMAHSNKLKAKVSTVSPSLPRHRSILAEQTKRMQEWSSEPRPWRMLGRSKFRGFSFRFFWFFAFLSFSIQLSCFRLLIMFLQSMPLPDCLHPQSPKESEPSQVFHLLQPCPHLNSNATNKSSMFPTVSWVFGNFGGVSVHSHCSLLQASVATLSRA